MMTRLLTQLQALWTKASVAGRVATIGTSLLLIATIVGVGVWSSLPDYKLLRDGISPQLTGEIKSVLDTKGIPNRMNFAGTGVKVPSSQWNKANIAIAGLNVPESTGSGGDGGGLLFPRAPGHGDMLRGKESGLERTIEGIRSIKSAEVHLAVPEKSPFRSKHSPTTASVIVEPVAGEMISRELSESIRHMVAAAVEGLDPERVTLVNSDGLLVGGAGTGDPASRRRDFIRNFETEKALKAQELLAAALGPHKAIVRVTAELDDYLERTVTLNKIDADGKVRLEETITSSDQKSVPSSGGVAGTGSNVAVASSNAGGQMAGKEESNVTTYDYPRSIETTQQVGGKLLRLWVSATVDVTPDGDTAGDPQAGQPVLTQEQVENAIKEAVGFDQSRGDTIHVTLAEIAESPALAMSAAVPESEKWEFALQLARHASLGLAAVVALLITTMTLKKIQPISIPAADEDRKQNELLSQLSTKVDQNPEAVSRILAAWLAQSQSGEAAAPMGKAA